MYRCNLAGSLKRFIKIMIIRENSRARRKIDFYPKHTYFVAKNNLSPKKVRERHTQSSLVFRFYFLSLQEHVCLAVLDILFLRLEALLLEMVLVRTLSAHTWIGLPFGEDFSAILVPSLSLKILIVFAGSRYTYTHIGDCWLYLATIQHIFAIILYSWCTRIWKTLTITISIIIVNVNATVVENKKTSFGNWKLQICKFPWIFYIRIFGCLTVPFAHSSIYALNKSIYSNFFLLTS